MNRGIANKPINLVAIESRPRSAGSHSNQHHLPRLIQSESANVEAVVREPRISADSHMAEPPDLWQKRLPAKFSKQALIFPKIRLYESRTHLRAGGWDPQERLKDQRLDGVQAEVLYPTLANQAYLCGDRELEQACIRVYNDWMIEFCSAAPDRLWGLAMISLSDIDHAIAELERCEREGLRGAAIGVVPPTTDLPYCLDYYDRFWAAAEKLGMPISMHIGSGPYGPAMRQRSGRVPHGIVSHKWDAMMAIGNMIVGTVFEQHPNLKVVVAEAGVGWIPFYAQEFDYYKNVFSGSQQALERTPSEYIYRQVYGTFISDSVGGYLLAQYGQDNFMWSNDYPHGASIWPHSAAAIWQDLGHLPGNIRSKITGLNAANLYNGGQLPPPQDPPGEVQDLKLWEAMHEQASD